ncbi:hypothetical protein DEM26_02520 [Thioclava sp. NG1]|uniref:hypothetical protein n=1 Tax=unclassified Thioclava TaxID=2621713 RepID=UPI000B53D89B|nr:MULTISPECIES: hypothetical protein [unclassified Thioclava]OWY03565.1 hypothetical protein B6V75_09035 [Thioclava sp. F1Mire-8]PWE51849.1 hypothetical protein DEM26_02520 [Thioclava sp. NG1]
MSRKIRNARIAMLSPLAFALAFGAYAGNTQTSREMRLSSSRTETPQVSREASEEVEQLTDWLERHGQA